MRAGRLAVVTLMLLAIASTGRTQTLAQQARQTEQLLQSLCATLLQTPPTLRAPTIAALCPVEAAAPRSVAAAVLAATPAPTVDPAILAALLAIEANQQQEIAAIAQSHATLDAFLKGVAKYLAGPIAAALATYMGTR